MSRLNQSLRLLALSVATAAAAATAHAQTAPAPAAAPAAPAAAPASPEMKRLVQTMLQLRKAEFELMAQQMVMQPLGPLSQQVNAALQRVAPERREALARDIDEDVRKFLGETVPGAQARAVQLAPSTSGAVLEERLTEDEMRQVLAIVENPAFKKFAAVSAEANQRLVQALAQDLGAQLNPKYQALQRTLSQRLNPPAPAGAAPAAAPTAAPAPAPARAPAPPAAQRTPTR
jgi:hypothetical protein